MIDVRHAEEFAAGHVAEAINLDMEDDGFMQALTPLDKTAPYLVYCRSGRRSAIAATLMLEAGFSSVTDLGSLENAAAVLNAPIVDQ